MSMTGHMHRWLTYTCGCQMRLTLPGVLQGLIPRGKELLKLGLSFFLAFGSLILGIAALAGTLYFLFGDQFIHGGRTSMSMPRYVDPYELLGQPTVDPTVPMRPEQLNQ